jgi:signal transduction histidine kinase
MSFCKKAHYSLSLKLMLLFIVSSIMLLVLFQFFVGSSFKHHFEQTIRPHFQHYIRYLHQEIGYPPSIEQAKALSERLLVDIVIEGPNTHWSSTGEFPDLNRFHVRPAIKQYNVLIQRGFYQGQFVFSITKQQYKTVFITRGAVDRLSFGRAIILGLLGILTILALLYFSIRGLFQPLKSIQADIQRIGSGELMHRVQTTRKDEFGELAQTVNQMADDIEQILEAKRQLLLAISHELRSPITRAKVALSLMGSSRLKQGLVDDLNEMEHLIHELLEAERLKSRHHVLNLSDSSLNELIQQVVASHFSGEVVILRLEPNIPILTLDETRIKFVIKNLLDNALKHTKTAEQAVEITTQHIDNDIKLCITDQGVGIAAEHLAHLSEPFYRTDPSRQRKTGGYGLGLYLVRLIIEAHGGEFHLASELGKGTSVTIHFMPCLTIKS